MSHIKIIQVNLHHAKGASAVLSRRFANERLDVGLIQEPWVNNGRVLGCPSQNCRLLYDESQSKPRTAILVSRKIKFVPITEFITRDIVAIKMEVPTTRGKTEVCIASAYFPGDTDDIPPLEVARFVDYCKKINSQFIIGCDANAHHTIWSSTDINKRGEDLLSYISSNNIDICNRGYSPTFVNAIRQEVLDLTICSDLLSEKIVNWHVSDEESLSDHKHIRFDYKAGSITTENYRNPRKTNWDLYRFYLSTNNSMNEDPIRTCSQLETASDAIIDRMISSYNASCPLQHRSSSRDVPWWNDRLAELRKLCRKLFNRAKITLDWVQYKKALTEYNRELRRAKRKDWRRVCEDINNAPTAARMQKVLSKDHSNGLGNLKKEDGSFTIDSSETLKEMMDTHFPGSIPVELEEQDLDKARHAWSEDAYLKACEIFTPSKVEWALSTFQPFKSAGKDDIFPALLQQGKETLCPLLTELFKASVTLSYIPKAWRKVRVVFIPKAGKRDKTTPKAFRPISLSSVLLKTMEKILDDFIKSTILARLPLSKFQFAYQSGKSTISALQSLVSKIEKSLQAKEIAMVAFLDIEGAFDNASYSSMRSAMEARGLDHCVIDWVMTMLKGREISADLGGAQLTIRSMKGCPQGGVLSPLLWSLVVDELLKRLAELGFEVIGYADDVTIIVRGKYENTISDRLQTALNITLKWCRKEGLNVNPSKTVIVPFTRRKKVTLTQLSLDGVQIRFSEEVKHLGVTLDKKLNWNSHLDKAITKGTNALWVCSKTLGKTWGLRPNMVHWIYSAIVRPKITYASLIWWPKINEVTAQKKLGKLQRLACISMTGAMKSTPSVALDALLNILPLYQFVKLQAAKSALKFKRNNKILEGDLVGHLRILKDLSLNSDVETIEDWMVTKTNYDVPFKVVKPSRHVWESGGPSVRPGSIVFYTDGSKMGGNTGAGVYGPGVNKVIPMGQSPTVFQAEIQAILECANICLRRNYRFAKICIFSDSQAALNAIKAFTCQSQLVWECIVSLKQLASKNEVTLYWVPGHCGIQGNENADSLARQGSASRFIGPEPFCGVSECALRMKLKTWEMSMVESNWNATDTCRQAKQFIRPSAAKARILLNLKKRDLRVITGLMTGHCPSKYHLNKMGITQSAECRFCQSENETAEHILCRCGALFRQRMSVFGRGLIEPLEIWQSNPYRVLDFIKQVEPSWDCVLHQPLSITS